MLVMADALKINGSKLIEGANMALPKGISITGGLAGDDENFIESVVMVNGVAKSNRVIAIGFYGDTIEVKSGCFSGWSDLGYLERLQS